MQRAWLIDVYGTSLDIDLDRIWDGLAKPSGLPPRTLRSSVDPHIPAVMAGRMTLTAAFAAGLRDHDVPPAPELLAEMDRLDVLLLVEHCLVHPDATRFMRERRNRGDRVALVSNSAANTRDLLDRTGLADHADAVVLSCEVGAVKPDRRIFDHTLALLGVSAEQATLIDDQLAYCRGAVEAGLNAVHLSRSNEASAGRSDITCVRSFDDVET